MLPMLPRFWSWLIKAKFYFILLCKNVVKLNQTNQTGPYCVKRTKACLQDISCFKSHFKERWVRGSLHEDRCEIYASINVLLLTWFRSNTKFKLEKNCSLFDKSFQRKPKKYNSCNWIYLIYLIFIINQLFFVSLSLD